MQAPHMFIFDMVSVHQTIPCALPAGGAVEERYLCTNALFLLTCKLSLLKKERIIIFRNFFHFFAGVPQAKKCSRYPGLFKRINACPTVEQRGILLLCSKKAHSNCFFANRCFYFHLNVLMRCNMSSTKKSLTGFSES